MNEGRTHFADDATLTYIYTLEARAQLLAKALNHAITRVELYYDTFGEVSDCSTHADIGDWLAVLATHRAMATEAA